MTKLPIKQSSHAQHQKYIGNHSLPAKFDKNDQLSSDSTPMVHEGAVLLAKNQVLPAKSEK